MADKSVTVTFQTQEEYYRSIYGDSFVGLNDLGQPLQARLEIDTDKTVGDEPYKIGQNVWLKYISNSGDAIIVRTTNGTAVLSSENNISEEATETIIFSNDDSAGISGIPTDGKISMSWLGSVLTKGKEDVAGGLCNGVGKSGVGTPNVSFDGKNLNLPEAVTGVLVVTYTETYAEILSKSEEAGTVVVAACQGQLATTAQYEAEEKGISAHINPDDQCCTDDPAALAGPESYSVTPGSDIGVYVSGGCTLFGWSIDGNGLSLGKSETIARANTLIASEDACGDGTLTVTDTCGSIVTSLIETGVGCCEDMGGDPLKWPDNKPDVLCIGISAIVVEGGVPPYTWAVIDAGGTAAYFSDNETDNPVSSVHVSDPVDPTTMKVRVTDSCDEILIGSYAVGMKWSDDNPETIAQGEPGEPEEVVIFVEGGAAPYSWTVSGTGFSLGSPTTEDGVNLLYADESACGPAEIVVTDDCETQVTGVVRGAVGRWVRYDADPYHCPWDTVQPADNWYQHSTPPYWWADATHGKFYYGMYAVGSAGNEGGCEGADGQYYCGADDCFDYVDEEYLIPVPCIDISALHEYGANICECFSSGGENWACWHPWLVGVNIWTC